MGREWSLTLICIGTSINRGFGCDMGNVESLGSRSPINARGSLIHPENKPLLGSAPRGGYGAAVRRSRAHSKQRIFRYALLRDTKVRDEQPILNSALGANVKWCTPQIRSERRSVAKFERPHR